MRRIPITRIYGREAGFGGEYFPVKYTCHVIIGMGFDLFKAAQVYCLTEKIFLNWHAIS
jgi:hypothetical protein